MSEPQNLAQFPTPNLYGELAAETPGFLDRGGERVLLRTTILGRWLIFFWGEAPAPGREWVLTGEATPGMLERWVR